MVGLAYYGEKAVQRRFGQAQRWAHDGMPVHREGGSTVADAKELSEWLGRESHMPGPGPDIDWRHRWGRSLKGIDCSDGEGRKEASSPATCVRPSSASRGLLTKGPVRRPVSFPLGLCLCHVDAFARPSVPPRSRAMVNAGGSVDPNFGARIGFSRLCSRNSGRACRGRHCWGLGGLDPLLAVQVGPPSVFLNLDSSNRMDFPNCRAVFSDHVHVLKVV